MEPAISPPVFSGLLLLGMLLMLEVGRRIGIRRRPKETEGERGSLGTIEGAVFALFGLVVAFSFSGAASRFNEKRELIAVEANCIETAYLRVRLVAQTAQPELQELFRRYTDSRLDTYNKLPDLIAAEKEMAISRGIQREIWARAISASQLPGSHADAGKLLLPALNDMIDITTTREMARQTHPPNIIYGLLFFLALICSLLAGYRMSTGEQHSWLHILSFAMITVVVIFVIIDVEYPRVGLIRLESFDQVLVDVRAVMN
jgi:hypothetical protein